MLTALHATREPANPMHQYYPRGHLGDAAKKLDLKKLERFGGWIYGGVFYSESAVETEEETDLEQCDGCGGQFPVDYCLADVRVFAGGRDSLDTLCNHCRLRNEDVRVKETASFDSCRNCIKEGCQWHPRRDMRQQPETLATVPTKMIEHKPAQNSGGGWEQSRYAVR